MTFAFVICGALRLARFNVQAQKPADATSKRYFVGLPIPAGAGLIASIVHFWKTPIADAGRVAALVPAYRHHGVPDDQHGSISTISRNWESFRGDRVWRWWWRR